MTPEINNFADFSCLHNANQVTVVVTATAQTFGV